MKKENYEDCLVKYSRENKKVNTLVSYSCQIVWFVAVKKNCPYIFELCYAEADGMNWVNKYLDGFEDTVIVCQDGPEAFKCAEMIQDGFGNDYDGIELFNTENEEEV